MERYTRAMAAERFAYRPPIPAVTEPGSDRGGQRRTGKFIQQLFERAARVAGGEQAPRDLDTGSGQGAGAGNDHIDRRQPGLGHHERDVHTAGGGAACRLYRTT
jgi:hypothetical protein